MEGAGGNVAEVDQEAMARVARLEAQRQQQLAESPYTAFYRAKFQARKDAKLARDKTSKAESSTSHQPAVAVPLTDPVLNSEDLLQAWNPRKHRQTTGNDAGIKSESLSPRRGSGPSSAATNASTTQQASSEPTSKRNKLDNVLGIAGNPSGRIGPLPKSRQLSNASESLPDRRKRSHEFGFTEDRRASKQARRPSTAASSPPPTSPTAGGTGSDRRPPEWYSKLPKPNGRRDPNQSAAETALTRIKGAIKNANKPNGQSKATLLATASAEIIDRLHKLNFLPVTDMLLRRTRMLDNVDGMPQLFDKHFSGGIDWPWYLRADAEELYNKWYKRVFEIDLYRGLIRAMKGKGNSNGANDKLEKGSERYKLVDPKQHGNGLLINGTWWPTQLAVFRDGGHGQTQGGITSHPERGAFSVIMAGGLDSKNKPYPNIDHGHEVLYCGTDNNGATEPSKETKAMIVNQESKRPVRLFRSSNLGSPYAPEQGFRYDGLYEVVDFELMDLPEEKEKQNRHRFRLLRCNGQDPIRYEGLAKRPTKEELEEYEKDKKNRGR